MSVGRIENTSLWKSSLGIAKKEEHRSDKEELRSSFFSFRKNVSRLVAQISNSLPNLTLHDISHLDALWETASVIAGDKYPLNPLEGFVLGGAILLHDSALCFEAYDEGVEGVRKTTAWKDAYAATKSSDVDREQSEEYYIRTADFIALRHLHAEQSASLIDRSWIDPETGSPMYLIENFNHRKHLGQLIGQISASHHWNIEEVASNFSSQVNSLPILPRDWRINPIKIACLLRCADAAHIDNERAPDFLHALIRRQGISFQHWQAQNRLANVDIDRFDLVIPSLLFTSTQKFTEQQSNAWWIAYDAARLVDKEIRSSNAVLESFRNPDIPAFAVKRVKGVESPELMTKYIQVDGWSPCLAEVHVGNVENLVKNLGGKQLYGSSSDEDIFQISIRELIQNARDAIQARITIESSFEGKIVIKLNEVDGSFRLIVEDNGVGMSQRILTGPLLDFGTSFWTSSLVQSEFPGLRASKFRPIGKFGIGFYSIFMVAKEVYVTSRPWKAGLVDAKQIQFKNGLSFRPLLKSGPFDNFGSYINTQVSLVLEKGFIDTKRQILIRRNLVNSNNINVHFKDYLSAICAGLDVSVYFKDENGSEILVHKDITSEEFKPLDWLKKISFSEYQDTNVYEYIEKHVDRLRPIKEGNELVGFAAISTIINPEQNFLSIRTIGGLSSTVHSRNGNGFIGFMDYVPKSAKRELNLSHAASEDSLGIWAQEQLTILENTPLDSYGRYAAGSSLSSYGVDPSSIVSVSISLGLNNHQFVSIQELAVLAQTNKIAILKSSFTNFATSHDSVEYIEGHIMINSVTSGSFETLEIDGDIPSKPYSLIGCLHRAVVNSGKKPVWFSQPTNILDRFGTQIEVLFLSVDVP